MLRSRFGVCRSRGVINAPPPPPPPLKPLRPLRTRLASVLCRGVILKKFRRGVAARVDDLNAEVRFDDDCGKTLLERGTVVRPNDERVNGLRWLLPVAERNGVLTVVRPKVVRPTVEAALERLRG